MLWVKNHDKPEAATGKQGEQKLLAAGGLNPTEMNEGRSEAIMKPSEYCSEGIAYLNVLPTVFWLCGFAGGQP